jgi:hypothetical protein
MSHVKSRPIPHEASFCGVSLPYFAVDFQAFPLAKYIKLKWDLDTKCYNNRLLSEKHREITHFLPYRFQAGKFFIAERACSKALEVNFGTA